MCESAKPLFLGGTGGAAPCVLAVLLHLEAGLQRVQLAF